MHEHHPKLIIHFLLLCGTWWGDVWLPCCPPNTSKPKFIEALLTLLLQSAPEEPHSLVQGSDSPSTPLSYLSPGKPAPSLSLVSEILPLPLAPPQAYSCYQVLPHNNKRKQAPEDPKKILALVLAWTLTCWTFLSAFRLCEVYLKNHYWAFCHLPPERKFHVVPPGRWHRYVGRNYCLIRGWIFTV